MEVRLTRFEEELIKKGNKMGALDSMLSRFNHLVQASGLFRELKKREHYEKPSVKRSRKRQNKIIKVKQQERENALHKEGTARSFRPRNKYFSTKTKNQSKRRTVGR